MYQVEIFHLKFLRLLARTTKGALVHLSVFAS